MMKKCLSLVCLVVTATFLITGCGKDDSTPPPATVDFIPLTTGTNWTYLSTEGTAAPVSFKLTVTDKDTTANSKTYKVIVNSAGDNGYLANSGSDHYRLATFPTIGTIEDFYLKDDKAVNDTWTSAATFNYSGTSLDAGLTYTIKEKAATRTVSGKNYTDVTHVRLDISITIFGAVGGGDFYYAKGIGMIESAVHITPPALLGLPDYTTSQLLTAYEIK